MNSGGTDQALWFKNKKVILTIRKTGGCLHMKVLTSVPAMDLQS
ncbi:MAG: hypothetical protein ACI92E_002240, partial [Oceanicoccus sp.]